MDGVKAEVSWNYNQFLLKEYQEKNTLDLETFCQKKLKISVVVYRAIKQFESGQSYKHKNKTRTEIVFKQYK